MFKQFALRPPAAGWAAVYCALLDKCLLTDGDDGPYDPAPAVGVVVGPAQEALGLAGGGAGGGAGLELLLRREEVAGVGGLLALAPATPTLARLEGWLLLEVLGLVGGVVGGVVPVGLLEVVLLLGPGLGVGAGRHRAHHWLHRQGRLHRRCRHRARHLRTCRGEHYLWGADIYQESGTKI